MKQRTTTFMLIIFSSCVFAQTPEYGTAEFVAAHNRFALELYVQLSEAEADKNIFVSPFGVYSVMTMAYAGTAGDTATEMKNALHFPDAPETLNPVFAERLRMLRRLDGRENTVLKIANAMWAHTDFKDNPAFADTYLAAVTNCFDARVEFADFVNEAHITRRRVNDWVKEKTDGKSRVCSMPSCRRRRA